MNISLRIKITANHHRKDRESIEKRVRRLENTVSNIDPAKQVKETLYKELRDVHDTAYEF
ncbi:MAG: hypothetical protein K1W38_19295 [Lachnospiraceae bacterium]